MNMAKGTLYLKNENNEFRWIENESTDKYDGKYVGQIKNGEPHGYGVFTYQNGERYEGEWKDGKRHGKGKYLDEDGREFKGEWKDGGGEGKGTITWKNGDKYLGKVVI